MILKSADYQLFENPRASRAAPYAADGRAQILSLAALRRGQTRDHVVARIPGDAAAPAVKARGGRRRRRDLITRTKPNASASAASRRSAVPTRCSSCCGRRSANERRHRIVARPDVGHIRRPHQADHGDLRDRRQSRPLGRLGSADVRLPLRDLRARDRQRGPLPRHRRVWRRGAARRRHFRRCGAASRCRRRRRKAGTSSPTRPTRATPTCRAT